MKYRLAVVLNLFLIAGLVAQTRVPESSWMQYADPAEAGFDAVKLDSAQKEWESQPSAAFMVVSEGAVVVAWGDVERRFMCHSVRKSFMSALYGIYWDQNKIDLNKTLADLGIDDIGDGLLESEKQARILDLLKARSGIFHPAAYAGRTDSQPRGSQGPGRYFAYNNWDFNTLVTIFEQETGDRFFESFDRYFGQPLAMNDWRVSDGYYHYELEKSKHPAYPFRMSARDAARIGLLFAREGKWGDTRILSRDWVRRSTALYSHDTETFGYGMLWWVAREPRFAEYGMFAALGVGNQMIAVLPELDLVIVNRANTYKGEHTPTGPLLDLIESIVEARVSPAVQNANLHSLVSPVARPVFEKVEADLSEFVGTWSYPPPPLGLPSQFEIKIEIDSGVLVASSPNSGTFREYQQRDGNFIEEDSQDLYVSIRDQDGNFAGLSNVNSLCQATLAAAVSDNDELVARCVNYLKSVTDLRSNVTLSLVSSIDGQNKQAETSLQSLISEQNSAEIESMINRAGYGLMAAARLQIARQVFELNTRLFPSAFNTWDSLAECCVNLAEHDDAIKYYQKSLELNDQNQNARSMIERLKSKTE